MSMIGAFVHATDLEIANLLSAPDQIVGFLDQVEESMDGRAIEIDKTWHALHWLLTGSEYEGEPPLNFIVSGGTEVGDVHAGYGPARAFTSDQVRSIDDALEQISTADLLARFDGNAMRDLYPGVWDRTHETESNLEELAYYFDSLKRFVAQARMQGLGIIAYLT